MAKPKIYGPAARRRINRSVVRSEASIDGAPLPGPPVGDGVLPRTYRRFKLTERLDAGGSAEVEWLHDESEGEVHDPDVCCWGLPGETGEAYAHATDDDEPEWRVSKNPGQAIYPAEAKDTVYAGDTGAFEIEIDGATVDLDAELRGALGPSEYLNEGDGVYIGHFRGSWYVVSFIDCAESY